MSDARLTLTLTSDRSEISRLVQELDAFGAAQHLSADDICNLQLLLDEVVANVMKHGHRYIDGHTIDIDVTLAGDLMTMRVEDDAPPFDPTSAPPPNLDLPIEERPIGGLGIYIARTLATTMEYKRVNGRNVLTMTKTVER